MMIPVTPVGRVLAALLSLSICAACTSSSDEEGAAETTGEDLGSDEGASDKDEPGGDVEVEGDGDKLDSAGDSDGEPGKCDDSVLSMQFPALYSAYDGKQLFQVPASVTGIAASAVQWSLSDPEIAEMQDTPEGVMLTIQKAGKATLVASAGTLCGSVELSVTDVDPEQWELGSARYNDGVVVNGGRGRRGMEDGAEPVEAACTSCHGESATMGGFQTIAHTPTQTAGFSDAELIKIFTEAVLPENAYFDESIVSIRQWQGFHKWGMSDDEKQAIVVYLRSLTPSDQTGERVRRMRNNGGAAAMGPNRGRAMGGSPPLAAGGEAAGGMGGEAAGGEAAGGMGGEAAGGLGGEAAGGGMGGEAAGGEAAGGMGGEAAGGMGGGGPSAAGSGGAGGAGGATAP